MMGEDRWGASISRVEGAAHDLNQAVQGVVDSLAAARGERREGVAVVDIVRALMARGGKELRLSSTVAFHDFERVVTDHRALMIAALVDDENLTLTEVSLLVGVSRQMVARLYRRGKANEGTSKD